MNNETMNSARCRRMGALGLIAASFCFAGMAAMVRLAGDLPTFEKAFFRNLIALAVSGIIILGDKSASFNMSRKGRNFVLLRSVAGTIGVLCNFYAISRLNLADASILNKMSPFYAVLFSFLILKERISWRQISVMLIAFIGSLLVVKPTPSNMSLLPSVIAALGGFVTGAAYTALRGATLNGVSKNVIIFSFSAFSCVVLLPFLILGFVKPSPMQLTFMLLSGCCSAGGQFFITAGYCYAPARDISVYDFTQVLFAALFGAALFGQSPDILSVCGYLIIIGLGVFNFVNDHVPRETSEKTSKTKKVK